MGLTWWTKRRWLITVTLLFLVSGGLAFLFWPREDELARWKAQMRARGENFTLAEVAPNHSPALKDWGKQFKAAVEGVAVHPVPPSGLELMAGTAPGFARPVWKRSLPVTPRITNQTWSALAAQFEASSNALWEIRELLRNIPAGTAGDYSNVTDPGGLNLVALRKGAQTLAAATANDLHRGARESALTNLLALIALTRPLEEEGSLVFQMIRSAIAGLGTSVTWETLQVPGWTDVQLAALDAAWARVALLPRMERAFVVERAWTVALCADARTNASGPNGIFGMPAGGAKQLYEDKIYRPLWQSQWSKTDELLFLQAIQGVGETIRTGLTNRSWQRMRAQLGAGNMALITNMNAFDRFRYPLAQSAIPNWHKALAALLRQETRLQMARAAIAIERHRLRHGRAPDSLARLVPEFLREPPLDYMIGQPLRYETNPDGSVVLYSVGEDGREDAGLGDDLVWPRPGWPARVTPDPSAPKMQHIATSNTPPRDVLILLAREAGLPPPYFEPKTTNALAGPFTLEMRDASYAEALAGALQKLGLRLVHGPKHGTYSVTLNPKPGEED